MNKTFTILPALILLCFVAIGFMTPQHARAQETHGLVSVRLITDTENISGGDDVWIGIEQTIKPKWHTYWKNPGDSGSQPRISWDMPDGFKVQDLQWPAPTKISYGPLLNYGYEGNVTLLQKLTVPQNIPTGPITLKADIEILVCEEQCIPVFFKKSITFNDAIPEDLDTTAIQNARNALPTNAPEKVFIAEEGADLIISTPLSDKAPLSPSALRTVEYFPLDWGIVDNTAPSNAHIENDTLVIKQARSDRALSALDTTAGLITFTNDNGTRTAWSFDAQHVKKSNATAHDTLINSTANTSKISIIQALIFAVFGGLILNLMPCVFPVLSIKAFSLVKISEKHPSLARKHGLSYSAGVVLSFLLIAGLLIILKSFGLGVGWGFQLQNPIVVSVLVYLLFVIGLNLSGYFEFSNPFSNTGGQLTHGNTLASSFFTGILATIVATPCTAPFMAGAIGFALTQTAIVSLLIFAMLGFGLALPYLALSFIPALQNYLPKPGAWMMRFKELLAFPMFASSAWLLWVLGQQSGNGAVLNILFGLIAISFAIWLLRSVKKNAWIKLLTILCLIIALVLIPSSRGSLTPQTTNTSTQKILEQVYSAEKLSKLLQGDHPIFIEMTASWCITCKVNHAVAINTNKTKALFKSMNVQYLVGDWTNYDENITKFLDQYGRNGVPIYIFYGARDLETGKRPEAKILPQILTPSIIKMAVS